jgi:hypothetical protein
MASHPPERCRELINLSVAHLSRGHALPQLIALVTSIGLSSPPDGARRCQKAIHEETTTDIQASHMFHNTPTDAARVLCI